MHLFLFWYHIVKKLSKFYSIYNWGIAPCCRFTKRNCNESSQTSKHGLYFYFDQEVSFSFFVSLFSKWSYSLQKNRFCYCEESTAPAVCFRILLCYLEVLISQENSQCPRFPFYAFFFLVVPMSMNANRMNQLR